jgi:hypothetical protein
MNLTMLNFILQKLMMAYQLNIVITINNNIINNNIEGVYVNTINGVTGVIGNANDNNNQLLRENAVAGGNMQIPQLPANHIQLINLAILTAMTQLVIYNLWTLYAMSQAAILTAVFSMERRKSWWSQVMLSGLISAAMIAAFLHVFFEELSVMRRGSHFRNFLINNWKWVVQRATMFMLLCCCSSSSC